MISAKNPKYIINGNIEITVLFPWLSEEVKFLATPDDVESYGRELYTRALSGEFGPIAEYQPPALTPEQVVTKTNAEARQYLASTDWYVIRQQETGKPIPVDILAARQAARNSII